MHARSSKQVVLVTGAARGIGHAVAARFVSDGALVVAFDLPGSGVGEAVEAFGTSAVAVEGDVAADGDVQRAVDAAAGFGQPLTALVNCAGIVSARPFLESDGAWFDKTMRVNARGAFLSSLAAGRAMAAAGGGAIVQIASTCAFGAGASRKLSAYNMSKAAVRQLVASLAGELAPHGIRVNAVAPGTIDTAMTRKCLRSDEAVAAMAATIPLQTVGQPDDVAAACAFLCSHESRFITGHTLVVDGGWLVR